MSDIGKTRRVIVNLIQNGDKCYIDKGMLELGHLDAFQWNKKGPFDEALVSLLSIWILFQLI